MSEYPSWWLTVDDALSRRVQFFQKGAIFRTFFGIRDPSFRPC
jgi:hypothetical protein